MIHRVKHVPRISVVNPQHSAPIGRPRIDAPAGVAAPPAVSPRDGQYADRARQGANDGG